MSLARPNLYESDSDTEENRQLPPDLEPIEPFVEPEIILDVTEVDPNEKKKDEKVEIPAYNGPPVIALKDDINTIPGQRYACVSLITPDLYNTAHHGDRKYQGVLLKIRGVFDTREEADAHIRTRILPMDPHFDVHLVKCGSWSPMADDSVQDREYADNFIGDMMNAYFEEEHDKKMDFNTRIQIAKDKQKRTKEGSQFYRSASNEDGVNPSGRMRGLPARPETLPDLPVGASLTSLDETRSRVQVDPEQKVKLVRNFLDQQPDIMVPEDKEQGIAVAAVKT